MLGCPGHGWHSIYKFSHWTRRGTQPLPATLGFLLQFPRLGQTDAPYQGAVRGLRPPWALVPGPHLHGHHHHSPPPQPPPPPAPAGVGSADAQTTLTRSEQQRQQQQQERRQQRSWARGACHWRGAHADCRRPRALCLHQTRRALSPRAGALRAGLLRRRLPPPPPAPPRLARAAPTRSHPGSRAPPSNFEVDGRTTPTLLLDRQGGGEGERGHGPRSGRSLALKSAPPQPAHMLSAVNFV